MGDKMDLDMLQLTSVRGLQYNSNGFNMTWTCILATLCVATILMLRRVGRPVRMNLPPGPRGWPILGSLYSLGPRDIPACRRFATLAEKFGPVMFLWMGSRPTLVVSNAEMAMALLKTQDRNFASRPRLATGKHFGYNYSSVVFAPSGAHFRRMKMIYTSELLSPTKAELLYGLRREEIRVLLASIFRHSGSGDSGDEAPAAGGVNVTSMVFNATLNIMGRMVFSKRLFADQSTESDSAVVPQEVEDFKYFVKAATTLVGLFNIGDYIPALRWLDLQGMEKTLRRLKQHREGLLVPIIQEYRRKSQSLEGTVKEKDDGRVDFIASLVAGYSELSDETITAVAIDVIVGGSDSLLSAIDWTLTELLRHPQYLQDAQEELDSVVGRERLVEESDIAKLPFLNCVVKESLRLHPPTPMAIPHASVEECTLGGYRIPANTTAYVNIWAIGRDPEAWKNPGQFDPTRFMDSKVNFYGQDFHFLPFSSGRRGCPGIHVGLATLKLMLANLLHCFTWTPAPGVDRHDIDMKERVGVVCSRLSPLLVSVTPRVPKHLILEDK